VANIHPYTCNFDDEFMTALILGPFGGRIV